MSLGLKAIIFDLDGVLWHSNAAHAKAFRQVLSGQGISGFRYVRVAGMKTEQALETFFSERRLSVSAQDIARLARQKRRAVLPLLRRSSLLRAGGTQVLHQLHPRYRLGLVSSAHPSTLRVFFKTSRTRRLFKVVLSGSAVRRAKPHPQIYKKALSLLKVKPRQALVIEDTVAGVKAAVGAGIPVMAIQGTCSASTLRRAGAFRVIQRLLDILSYAKNR